MAKDDDFVDLLIIHEVPPVVRIRQEHAVLSNVVTMDHITRLNVFFHIQ